MSINHVCLSGHLGRDVEVRFLNNGNAVANFSLATSEKWTDKATGDVKERTEWHNIVVYGKLGELCGQYLKKGSKPTVMGQIRSRKYNAKDGTEKVAYEIIADRVDFPGQQATAGAQRQQTRREPGDEPRAPKGDSDIPF